MTSQTLRIPKGLWADLEETVIQQDRRFLTEVAQSLGLPVQEVLRRCLGNGAATPIPVLWFPSVDTTEQCPWWSLTGALWKPCHRSRMSPTLACCHHVDATPNSKQRMMSDPYVAALPTRWPVRYKGELLWADPAGIEPALHEDGRVEKEGRFRFFEHLGKRCAIFIKTEVVTT